MDASEVAQLCSESEGALSPQVLETLATCSDRIRVPADHVLGTRLASTIAIDGTAAIDALALLSQLSVHEDNGPFVVAVLEASAAYLESSNQPSQIERDSYVFQSVLLSSKVRGGDVLELFNKSASRCIAACSTTLRRFCHVNPCVPVEGVRAVRTVVETARVLHELVSYRTYWTSKASMASDKPMSELTRGFDAYVAAMNEALLKSDVLDVVSLTMQRWYCDIVSEPVDASALRLLPELEDALCSIMHFLSNTLSYTSAFTVMLRKHLTTNTTLLHDVVLPFLLFLLDSVERRVPLAGATTNTMCLLVRTLSLIMFNVRAFRPALGRFPQLGRRLCQCAVAFADGDVADWLAAVTRLVVNAELVDSVGALLEHASALSDCQRGVLSRKLSNPRERSSPIQIFCATYATLKPLFDLRHAVDTTSTGLVSNRTLYRRRRNKRRRERNRARYQALRQGPSGHGEKVVSHRTDDLDEDLDDSPCLDSSASSSEDGRREHIEATEKPQPPLPVVESANEVPQSLSDDSPPPPPLSGGADILSSWRTQPTPHGAPERYLCSLTRQIMTIPVISPYGDAFNKDSILSFLKQHGNRCPLSNEELYATDLVVDPSLKRELDVVRFNYC